MEIYESIVCEIVSVLFKIDLIVWKSGVLNGWFMISLKFKIDLIVWKYSGLQSKSLKIRRLK